MRQSIKDELQSHIMDRISDGVLTDENRDDWHHHAFNEDYYIIGYYQAGQWLRKHGLGESEAANICVKWEQGNFGECYKEYNNAETVVNMLAYIWGEEILGELHDCETVAELKEALEIMT